jgi:hypothetical protein
MINNLQNGYVPETKTFKANMSTLSVNLLYSLMLKRISKGFSTADMSFLMGYPYDCVNDNEELISVGYAINDIYRYCDALGEKTMGGIILNDFDEKESSEHQLFRTTYAEIIQYDMYMIGKEQPDTLIFRLYEGNPEFKKVTYFRSYESVIKQVTAILDLLFEGAFFLSPQIPMNIYTRCRTVCDPGLYPNYVEKILHTMTIKKEFPKLKRTNTRGHGCTYGKVFGKKIKNN